MLRGYFEAHPEERAFWQYDSLKVIPAGTDRLGHRYSRFDEVTPLHPTPLYELLFGIGGFLLLWKLRTRPYPDGKLFMIYLMLASVFRFTIEFLRLNPRVIAGLSEAQVFAVGLFFVGFLGMLFLDKRSRHVA
jgi:prolipoprotein diacylglyceryltransferase